jgi:hypothetical protein
LWLVVSWVWIAIVALYSIWSAVNYAGLFRWAANLEIEKLGGYSEKWTAILPGMTLAAPAFWFIGRRAALDRAEGRQAPVSEARGLARTRLIFCVAGIIALSVGAGSWLLSQNIPDGSEPAVAFDASRLGTAPVPKGKVVIRGEAMPEASGTLTSDGLLAEASVYAGFRVVGEAAGNAPVRLFIERRFGDSRDAATAQFFLPEQEGYLIQNGLPGAVLEDLRRRGIAIASPHYVLRTSAGARRDPYYVVAGLGAFFGLMFLAFALAVTIRAGRLLR